MENILMYVLIGVLLAAFSNYLRKESEESAQEITGGRVLKSDKAMGKLGLLGILLGSVFLIYPIVDVNSRNFQSVAMGLVALLVFGSIGLYLYLYSKNTKTEFNESFVKTTNFFGKSKSINWSDIQNIDYSPTTKWLLLQGENKKIYVPSTLKGFSQLKKELSEKVGDEKCTKAFAKM